MPGELEEPEVPGVSWGSSFRAHDSRVVPSTPFFSSKTGVQDKGLILSVQSARYPRKRGGSMVTAWMWRDKSYSLLIMALSYLK